MIARMWRGSAIRERADDYIKHLQQSVVPELRQIDGFKGIYLLRRESSDGVEFVVLIRPGHVVTFINNCRPIILESVCVRRAKAD